MSKEEMTPEQRKMVRTRKVARAVFALFLMGGALFVLVGIYTLYLPTVWYGIILFMGSLVPFYASKKLELKLQKTLT